MIQAGRSEDPEGSRRTSEGGLWLLTGWKSNTSREELRAEFIEDIAATDKSVWETLRGKGA